MLSIGGHGIEVFEVYISGSLDELSLSLAASY